MVRFRERAGACFKERVVRFRERVVRFREHRRRLFQGARLFVSGSAGPGGPCFRERRRRLFQGAPAAAVSGSAPHNTSTSGKVILSTLR